MKNITLNIFEWWQSDHSMRIPVSHEDLTQWNSSRARPDIDYFLGSISRLARSNKKPAQERAGAAPNITQRKE